MCAGGCGWCDGSMTGRTDGGCAAAALVCAELAAVAVIFLKWSLATYGNADPQHVGPRVGAYVAATGVVAGCAAVAAAFATARRARRFAWSQAVMVGVVVAVMAGVHDMGTREYEKRQRQACQAGLLAPYCARLTG